MQVLPCSRHQGTLLLWHAHSNQLCLFALFGVVWWLVLLEAVLQRVTKDVVAVAPLASVLD